MNDQPSKPDWKQSKCEHDKQHQEKFRATPTGETLPHASYRFAYLKDADTQVTALLDHLQSMGVPLGSETWAMRALARIRHLEDIHRATIRLIRSPKEKPMEDLQRLVDDVDHARKMLVKVTPPMRVVCDYCGWDGARAIGDGWAACPDCLGETEKPLAESPTGGSV
jgi:hypothetical protein